MDAPQTHRTQIEIPQSVVELTLPFLKPVVQFAEGRAETISQFLAVLEPSGFGLDGVEWRIQTGKLSDHSLIFRRTRPQTPALTITLFYDRLFINAENVDWRGAETLITTINLAIKALASARSPVIKSKNVALGIHVQLKDRDKADVVSSLVTPIARSLVSDSPVFTGAIVTSKQQNIFVESSVVYANALWIRIFREHPSEATLEVIAETLRQDELRVFGVLGLEGEL